MRPSDQPPGPDLDTLPKLPQEPDGPVFAEPWQASAFALAVSLSRQGHFTWREWADTLSQKLRESAARGDPDDGSRYYNCWLDALEHLVIDRRLLDVGALREKKDAWAEAYRRTPHGQPVTLMDEINRASTTDDSSMNARLALQTDESR